MSAAGIVKQTVDGLRVTSPQALAIVRRVLQAENLKLVEALREVDARATSIMSACSNPSSSTAKNTASSAR